LFLIEMDRVVPWKGFELPWIEPHYPRVKAVVRPIRWWRCCACTWCKTGSVTAIQRWKRRCTRPPSCASSRGWAW